MNICLVIYKKKWFISLYIFLLEMERVKKIEKMYMPNNILPLATIPRRLIKSSLKESTMMIL